MLSTFRRPSPPRSIRLSAVVRLDCLSGPPDPRSFQLDRFGEGVWIRDRHRVVQASAVARWREALDNARGATLRYTTGIEVRPRDPAGRHDECVAFPAALGTTE